jgi:DNA-directed RNA polymerase III subunit RPC1
MVGYKNATFSNGTMSAKQSSTLGSGASSSSGRQMKSEKMGASAASSSSSRVEKEQESKQAVKLNTAPKRISKIQFGTMTRNDIRASAEFAVTNRVLTTQEEHSLKRVPAKDGCMDSRLGVSDKTTKCQTCHQPLALCSGHFGYIQLKLPVFHAGYFKHTLTILQCICKGCSRVLLDQVERDRFLRKLQATDTDALGRTQIFKKVVEACKRGHKCPYCDHLNGVVKKVGGGVFKIVHDITKGKGGPPSSEDIRSREIMINALMGYNDTVVDDDDTPAPRSSSSSRLSELNRTVESLKNGGLEHITPLMAYNLLRMINDEDAALLWMNGDYGRPESVIIWNVPVPPVPIRPSVPVDVAGGGTTEDDLTIKLQEIIMMNDQIIMSMKRGMTIKNLMEDWEVLQINVAQFINGETQGVPRAVSGQKATRGLCQRLKGKQGRFRGNLSGKRVDFSGRTVISPDPNLAVEQVGIPQRVAVVMTYPERVFKHNMGRLQQMIRNGPRKHPGANVIRKQAYASRPPQGILLEHLTPIMRDKEAHNLKVGDVVERHMMDGDIVMFNRQPSLHKMSIMAHRVKVMPWRTFRFNECACTPYNADFDGDEMNLHLPQTEEARVEAEELMSIQRNLVTPRNGEVLVAATQDFLTCAYLITRQDQFFSREEFARLVAYMSDAEDHIVMPQPAIYKPRELYTGKQLIAQLITPPDRNGKTGQELARSIIVESMEKFYSGMDRYMCPMDGYVCIYRGELVCGRLGKKTLGSETKAGLFHVLIRDMHASDATRVMGRLAKLSARYMGDRGFSIGIHDVTPDDNLRRSKREILVSGQARADELITQYHQGSIRLKAGCDALQSLESEVGGLLGRIRQQCGDEAIRQLHHSNAALCMAQAGSKGSPLNISQMMSCLGQQSVGGQRIQNGFEGRTLPHFEMGALSPGARGFAANSFYSGLTPTEFFFHTMGGREGLVDTAVKTAETGYMARRLMKALEDLSMQYDNTVRNSEKHIVQFSYGDDRLNPHLMETEGRPVNYDRLAKKTLALIPCHDEYALDSIEIIAQTEKRLNDRKDDMAAFPDKGDKFCDETKAYFNRFADNLKNIEDEESGFQHSTKDDKDNDELRSIHELRKDMMTWSMTRQKKWRKESQKIGTLAYRQCHRLMRSNVYRMTISQLNSIIDKALDTYNRAIIEPGEAVGAIGAQSLSEPGTQMTLKTFHFAGVASMNVTLGVPRLKEIINGSKQISTPIIEARLVQSDNITSARIVKAQIEKTTLGEIAKSIKSKIDGTGACIIINLDSEIIRNYHLAVDAKTVRESILNPSAGHSSPIIRALSEEQVILSPNGSSPEEWQIYVFPPDEKLNKKHDREAAKEDAEAGRTTDEGVEQRRRGFFTLHALKKELPGIIVKGAPSISRAIINEEPSHEDSSKREYYLLLEGYGLADVMGSPGVDGLQTKSNHIMDMHRVLGIEAARVTITEEIKYIMSQYGIVVDVRHLMLLSDVMTFRGEVLGITRFGVAKMRESVLMLASFEKTTDHLFDAAVHSREDAIVGVSECIIMGVPIPLGTGLFKLVHRARAPVRIERRNRLLDRVKAVSN